MGLQDLFDQSETVFIGTVTGIADAPGRLSGVLAAFRGVTYAVNGVLKGNLSDSSAQVFHYVVSDLRDRQPANTTDPATPFRIGAQLLVFSGAGQDPDNTNATRLEEIDSDDGVFELTPDLRNRLVAALGSGAGGGTGTPASLRIWLIIAILLAIAGWIFALL